MTIPEELLPVPDERRGVDRAGCAGLLDGLLRRLARQEALCRRILGRLARSLLLRRGHQRLGFVRLDDYARERLGLSGRELQELSHVAERLETLPLLAAAFADGALSWSHLRLVVSVATAETEASWLARARCESVRVLESTIAKSRGDPRDPDEDAVDGEPRARFHVACPRRVRRLWRHASELASRMSGARLAAWQAAEAIAAESLASAAADASPVAAPRPCAGGTPLPSPSAWEAIVEALPDDIERLLRDADYANAFELDARLRAAVHALQRIDFQTGRLLRLVCDLRLHRVAGFPTLSDYVRERLGFSCRKARALIALDRRLAELPTMAAAYREGRLSFARALVLLPVSHADTEAAWVARAAEVTVRRLGDLVEWALEVQEPGHPIPPPAAEDRLVFPPVQMCARGGDAAITFNGPATVVALLRTAIRAFTPPGAPPWEGLERVLLHVIAEWQRRPRHRDPVFERDGWRCAVPACTARSSLQDHHVVYRSRGGDNARDNRVAICAAHHLNGIHRMRIRVHGIAPADLTWEIGVRRGGPPLFRTHGDRYVDS